MSFHLKHEREENVFADVGEEILFHNRELEGPSVYCGAKLPTFLLSYLPVIPHRTNANEITGVKRGTIDVYI